MRAFYYPSRGLFLIFGQPLFSRFLRVGSPLRVECDGVCSAFRLGCFRSLIAFRPWIESYRNGIIVDWRALVNGLGLARSSNINAEASIGPEAEAASASGRVKAWVGASSGEGGLYRLYSN